MQQWLLLIACLGLVISKTAIDLSGVCGVDKRILGASNLEILDALLFGTTAFFALLVRPPPPELGTLGTIFRFRPQSRIFDNSIRTPQSYLNIPQP